MIRNSCTGWNEAERKDPAGEIGRESGSRVSPRDFRGTRQLIVDKSRDENSV